MWTFDWLRHSPSPKAGRVLMFELHGILRLCSSSVVPVLCECQYRLGTEMPQVAINIMAAVKEKMVPLSSASAGWELKCLK